MNGRDFGQAASSCPRIAAHEFPLDRFVGSGIRGMCGRFFLAVDSAGINTPRWFGICACISH
jgi:hypothetical protein